jgi:hypothetical protein
VCPKTTSKHPRRASQEKKPDLSQLSARKLLARFDNLRKQRVPILFEQAAEEPARDVDIELPKIEAEIHQRINAGNRKILNLIGRDFKHDVAPIMQAELPEVPGNLQPVPNEKLDQLTAEMERRITRFTESYPNLNGTQSQWVREVLDAQRHSLQEERTARGLPPLPSRIEANPPVTGAEAAKKEPVRKIPSPTVELDQREEAIWNVIQRQSKGLQYCRELDGAGIRTQRTGVWKCAPLTYVATYQAGKPWCHRIEDEKSKVKQKAKLAKLAPKLAGE